MVAGDISPGLDPGDLSPVLLPQPGTHEARRAQPGQSSGGDAAGGGLVVMLFGQEG